MNYVNWVKNFSKHLNLKRIQLFLTWLKNPFELIPIHLKWLIAMVAPTNSPKEYNTKDSQWFKYVQNNYYIKFKNKL